MTYILVKVDKMLLLVALGLHYIMIDKVYIMKMTINQFVLRYPATFPQLFDISMLRNFILG